MKKDLNFIGKRKIFFCISLAIIAIGILCNLIFGARLDIQFKGGTIITYGYVGEVEESQIEDIIQKSTPDYEVTFNFAKDIMNSSDNEQAYSVSVEFSGNNTVSIDEQQTITKALTQTFPDNKFEVKDNLTVEASMGAPTCN